VLPVLLLDESLASPTTRENSNIDDKFVFIHVLQDGKIILHSANNYRHVSITAYLNKFIMILPTVISDPIINESTTCIVCHKSGGNMNAEKRYRWGALLKRADFNY